MALRWSLRALDVFFFGTAMMKPPVWWKNLKSPREEAAEAPPARVYLVAFILGLHGLVPGLKTCMGNSVGSARCV
jgi:hypothetical protein